KKMAEGIDALVLDCKVGAGAFMKTLDQARQLGQAIRVIGAAAGTDVSVLFTDMDKPIGRQVGHALEVRESIAVLRGDGPADTRELTVRLGAEMLRMVGLANPAGGPDSDSGYDSGHGSDGAKRIAQVLDSGAAAEVFAQMIAAQGGDRRVVDDPELLPRADQQLVITAPHSGHVAAVSAIDIGVAALHLGGGRMRKEDAIDPAVGIELHVRVGDRVEAGQELARLHHNQRGVATARAMVAAAFTIADEPPTAVPASRIIDTL
ncbi:MAG: thymidine phosphorylase, partial [Myxococcota bacterium]